MDRNAGLWVGLTGLLALLAFQRRPGSPAPAPIPDEPQGGGDGGDDGALVPIGTTAESGLQWVVDAYGATYARQIERLVRLETAHLSSGQWTACHTPGMVALSDVYPYGWPSLATFAAQFPAAGIGPESTGTVRVSGADYVRLPDDAAGIIFTAWFLQTVRGGNVAAWYSLTESGQAHYNSLLVGVRTPIVDGLMA